MRSKPAGRGLQFLSAFRGARMASEPGIQKFCAWLASGSAASRRPGMTRLADHVGQQTEETRALDGARELTLLPRRDRGDAARHDLAALRDVTHQQLGILVVDLRRVGTCERAGLAAAKERTACTGVSHDSYSSIAAAGASSSRGRRGP